MYSSDGQSVQVSLSSKGGKAQVIYAKPSSTTSMETHWEEAIQCAQPERRAYRKTEPSVDGEDTESELIAIPESDMSDSTLHGSTQVRVKIVFGGLLREIVSYRDVARSTKQREQIT